MTSIIVVNLVKAESTLDEEILLKADTGYVISNNMISILIKLQDSCYAEKIDI